MITITKYRKNKGPKVIYRIDVRLLGVLVLRIDKNL